MYDFNFKFDLLRIMKSPVNLNIAKKYHKYDNVESFEITQVPGGFRVNGVVDVRGDTYECQFYVDFSGELGEINCDCAFCSSNNPCAHIGAILFKINTTYIDSIPFEYRKNTGLSSLFNFQEYFQKHRKEQEERERIRREQEEERKRKAHEELMERIRIEEEQRELQRLNRLKSTTNFLITTQKSNAKNQILSLFDSTTYSIYPELTHDGYSGYQLSYKIGTDNKKYVIRSITDLIKYFHNKETVNYGKNFAICHEYERFDEFSRKQLQFLERVEAKPQGDYYYSYNKKGRFLTFDGSISGLLHDFYELYKDNDNEYNFTLWEMDYKIKCELINKKDYYILRLVDDLDYQIEGNALYQLSGDADHYLIERMLLDPQHIVEKLLNQFSEDDNEIYIYPNQYDEFDRYILQPIKNYIELEGKLPKGEKTMPYDKITVYGDVDEDGEIFFDVNYHYQGEVYPAFVKEQLLDYNQTLVEMVLKEYASEVEPGKAYFDSSKDKTVKFCSQEVEKLQPYCEIYISQALKHMSQKAKQTITVGVRVENDLIALDISSLEIPKDELANVLSSYRRKKKFYRLKSGEMINIDSEQMEALDQFMEDYHLDAKELKKDEIKLNKYRMFELEEEKEDGLIVNREQSYQRLMNDFKEISSSDIEIPENYQTILRDYQKEGYRWLYTMHQYGFNGILADDMGLGKTLQVISLLEGIDAKQPNLVVCPASLIYNWEDEVHKFSKKLNVVSVVGSKAQRQQIINKAYEYDLLVTSYDYMRRDCEDYQKTQFEYVILDEAQNIKNQKTKNAASVKMLHANHRLALTGTPIENTLAELWSIFDFLMPDYLFNYHYFKKNYETPIVKNGKQEASDKLKRMVSPFILRRNKKDVLKELPEKIETVQVIPFEEEENKLYLANLSRINDQLAEMLEMESVDKFMILAMLTRLRQLCIEPRMVYENITDTSSKMKALLELLVQLKENNQRTLVFSAFPSVFDYIEEDLKEANITYMELTGSNSKEERREMVERFQNEEVDVFLISLKAGGTGLNLTKASAVIHIDPWWNLSAQNQATDRAHRIGQHNTVQVFKLVMKNSIEEKIVKLQEKKKELADLFVENNEGSIASMTKQEMIDLFKMN